MPNLNIGTHRLPQAPSPGVSLNQAPKQPPAFRVMPPVMPALPPIPTRAMPPLPQAPPANPWVARSNPSAALVQKQYVDLRLEELEANRKLGRKDALEFLEQMLLDRLDPAKKHRKIPFKELIRTYNEMERNLQAADLTINFHAHAWFSVENLYDTYTQMYERALEGGRMVLRSTDLNNAEARAEADNQITFPDNWKGVQTAARRGLSPGRQGADRIMRQMDTGLLGRAPVVQADDANKGFYATNGHFNPHTKQIFLGLNYGRRPHGSARNFGWSYFVLRNKLKPRCLFYAGDTFMQLHQGTHAGTLQVTFDNLGALFGMKQGGDFLLRHSIFQSCYEGKLLPDPDDQGNCKFYLVEAHHFGDLKFNEHVKYLVISPKGVTDMKDWPTIVENARKFTQRHGIQLYQTE